MQTKSNEIGKGEHCWAELLVLAITLCYVMLCYAMLRYETTSSRAALY